MLKQRMLVGSFALAFTAVGYAATAEAGALKVYGTGSSLVAPYAREAMDCYGKQTDLVFSGPVVQTIPYFYFAGSPSFDCNPANPHSADAAGPVNPDVKFNYESTGSGAGIKGITAHASYGGDTDPGPGTFVYPSIQYGFSDASLDGTSVGVYTSGGGTYAGDNQCNDGHDAGHSPNTTAGIGLCVAAPGSHPPAGSNGVENPHERYGALIQIPFLIAPVTIAYDPVYKRVRQAGGGVTEYSFHIHKSRADGSGGLHLDAKTYCAIFNGKITDWADPRITKLNHNELVRDPSDPVPAGSWHLPIVMVGRGESSGTTSLWTRHLANVCAAFNGNHYLGVTTTLPSDLRDGNAVYDKTTDTLTGTIKPGNYVVANGNDGVAQYIDFRDSHQPGNSAGDSVQWGRLGYVGPDYALPAVLNTGANTYGLNTATVKNSSGNYVAPTVKATLAAFGSATPPDSLPNGHYDPGSADSRDRTHPQDWVEPPDPSSPLANPTAADAYPIVGTSNALVYTCYATLKMTRAIGTNRGFLNWFYNDRVVTNKHDGLLAQAGFGAMPSNWRVAITESFISGKDGLRTGNLQGGRRFVHPR